MPSGEVFTGPLEDSAEGRIRYTIPSGPRGVAVEGIELEFRGGPRRRGARRPRRGLPARTLATDAGASRLGEIGIGTNFGIDRPVGAILFDEKIGGTVHLAVGRSYPETGGINESAVHWDMICDLRHGGRLSADGEPLVEDGATAQRVMSARHGCQGALACGGAGGAGRMCAACRGGARGSRRLLLGRRPGLHADEPGHIRARGPWRCSPTGASSSRATRATPAPAGRRATPRSGSSATRADGGLDTDFGAGGMVTTAVGAGRSQAFDVVVRPDGTIVAGGVASATWPIPARSRSSATGRTARSTRLRHAAAAAA